jgi:hypothetical protein
MVIAITVEIRWLKGHTRACTQCDWEKGHSFNALYPMRIPIHLCENEGHTK